MDLLAGLVKWEIQLFVLALAGLIGIKLLTGEIHTSGLLYGRSSSEATDDDQYFSAGRVQLLVFTLGAGLYYLSLVLNNPNPGTFPEIPQNWAAAVGGSNAVYLAGKASARWVA